MNNVQGSIQNNVQSVGEQLKSIPQAISAQVSNVQSSISNTMNDFSSKNVVSGSTEFLQSNSIIAKFVFLVLVLIGFMFFLSLGVSIIGYFVQPSTNPYIVKGLIDGNNGVVVPQDPKNSNAATVLRSNDQSTGIEYSWSVWLYISDLKTTSPTYQNIFNKGNGIYDINTGMATVNNSPGLYLNSDATKTSNMLHVAIDTVDPNVPYQTVDISGVPFNKWVHVALRLENNIFDIYVNGTISGRTLLNAVAKQNYNDIQICQNGGFNGKLSDLRYFNRALSAFEINNIVMYGPNTTPSNLASINGGKFPYYLSDSWYTSKL